MKYGIAETLQKAEALTGDERTAFLRSNDSPVLRGVITMAYHKALKWAVPEGAPPFKENQFPGNQPNLYASWRRMYLFFPGGGGEMPALKRESLFIQFLEGLDPDDAKLICAVKDKTMPYKITKAQFEKAFPGIFDSIK